MRFEHLARRFGPTYDERIYGSPLEPWVPANLDAPAHASWFVGGKGGEVGALWHEGALHLAVNEEGAGWLIEGQALTPLSFGSERPQILQHEPADLATNLHQNLRTRREPLKRLRFCRVEVKSGQRLLLSSGLSIHPPDLLAVATAPALLETIAAKQPKPKRGLMARMLGSAPAEPKGAVLTISCHDDEVAPKGFLPWLVFHEQRGVSFDWMGNEGGGGMLTHVEPAPEHGLEGAVLRVLRDNDDVREGISVEAWEEWQTYGEDQPGFERLIEDAPERGFWRHVALEDLTTDLNGRSAEYLASGTADARLLFARHVPGAEIVQRLRQFVVEPLAIALHQVPSDESVVVWFAIGGVSKVSGQLELMLVERVWS